MAIVHDQPGVTRDYREGTVHFRNSYFKVFDTAGLSDDKQDLDQKSLEKTFEAIEKADLILFIVDGKTGLLSHDRFYAQKLRRFNKPVLFAANKCDRTLSVHQLNDFLSLGFGEPQEVSALNGHGVMDILIQITDTLKDLGQTVSEYTESPPLQIALVGRPNAGKSTLINHLIGEERVITSDVAGTTRDAIALEWTYKGQPIKLIDTAGMRGKAKISEQVEKYAVQNALRTIQYAQIVILLTTPDKPLSKQDLTLANHVIKEGRVLLIAVNKWDQVENKQALLDHLKDRVYHSLGQIKGIPCLPISAFDGKNVHKLLDVAFDLYQRWDTRIPTGELNRWLRDLVAYHPPPIAVKNRIRIKYMTQIKSRPPTFALFMSKPEGLPESYLRYLLNQLRDDFQLPGIPIRLVVRKGKNPYSETS